MSMYWATVYFRPNQDRRTAIARMNSMASANGLPPARPVSKPPEPAMGEVLGRGVTAVRVHPRLHELWTQDQAKVTKKPPKQARRKATGKPKRGGS